MTMSYKRVAGRLSVGVRDLDYDVADKSLPTKAMGLPPDQHLVGQLFYPCQPVQGAKNATWMPHSVYAEGVAVHTATPLQQESQAFKQLCAGFAHFVFLYSKHWWKSAGKASLRGIANWMCNVKLPAQRVCVSLLRSEGESHVTEAPAHRMFPQRRS